MPPHGIQDVIVLGCLHGGLNARLDLTSRSRLVVTVWHARLIYAEFSNGDTVLGESSVRYSGVILIVCECLCICESAGRYCCRVDSLELCRIVAEKRE